MWQTSKVYGAGMPVSIKATVAHGLSGKSFDICKTNCKGLVFVRKDEKDREKKTVVCQSI